MVTIIIARIIIFFISPKILNLQLFATQFASTLNF